MTEQGDREEERRAGPPTEERVRLELVLFADLIQRLENEGRLADALPFVLHRLGDLRRLLFDYEVRATERLKGAGALGAGHEMAVPDARLTAPEVRPGPPSPPEHRHYPAIEEPPDPPRIPPRPFP
jgi:hypothetical protein